eukprot:gene9698-6795_t
MIYPTPRAILVRPLSAVCTAPTHTPDAMSVNGCSCPQPHRTRFLHTNFPLSLSPAPSLYSEPHWAPFSCLSQVCLLDSGMASDAMMSGLWWQPTACQLQLHFSPPSAGGLLLPGTAYKGLSTLRYRKTSVVACPAARLVPEQLRDQGRAPSRCGLHLHAYTKANGAKPLPMSVTRYKLNCRQPGGANNKVRRGDQLKICQIEEEAPTTAVEIQKKGGGQKSSRRTKAPPATRPDANPDADSASKMIYFEGEEALAEGAEVELAVAFTAYVQEAEHGGVFAPARVSSLSTGAIATHFEVRLARLAFPCPDDPAYRLVWTLQCLQVPEVYRCAFANTPCVRMTALPHQNAVSFAFSPCGPLPAYLLAFALFTEAVPCRSKSIPYPPLSPTEYLDLPLEADDATPSAPTSTLLVEVAATVPLDLDQLMRLVLGGLALLQNFFLGPIPLLQPGADEGETEARLAVLVGPTAPFIGGMEHHGLICLNESLFGPSGGRAKSKGDDRDLYLAMLVVHELAHHWVGNAIGLPFALKEGICQVLEQHFGPVLLGRNPKPIPQRDASDLADPAGGKELTFLTYLHALHAVERIAGSRGLPRLRYGLRQLVRDHVVRAQAQAWEHGSSLFLARDGSGGTSWPIAPYLSTAAVLGVLMESGDTGAELPTFHGSDAALFSFPFALPSKYGSFLSYIFDFILTESCERGSGGDQLVGIPPPPRRSVKRYQTNNKPKYRLKGRYMEANSATAKAPRVRFASSFVPPPSGAALSLHALVRIVSFFGNGVPRAFAAASPLARLAAETYRAEENYRWTPDGLVLRDPGERETFDTYEARRQRRAGLQLGRLIVVYHDALGHLERETIDPVEPRQALSVDPGPVVRSRDAVAARQGLERQSLLREERCVRSIFAAPGKMEDGVVAPWPAEAAIHRESPAGGLLLHQAEQFSLVSFDSRRGAGDPVRVYYLPGPNRRSVYVWMTDEEDERKEEAAEPPPCASMHQRDLRPKPPATRATMEAALAASRWWLERPCVSTLQYLEEVPYANDSPFMPPPPPSLHLHLYGATAARIPQALNALHPPPKTIPPPGEELEPEPWRAIATAVDAAQPSAASVIRDRVEGPVLEGLYLIGHPLMALQLTRHTLVELAHSHLDQLKVLKLNGIYADDAGLQALLQLRGVQGRAEVRKNARPPEGCGPGVVPTHSTTSLLEVADFGFCLSMSIFPLLVAPRGCSPTAVSAVTPLEHLTSLNLQGTSVASDVLTAVASSCPALEVLLVGSCQYITDLHALVEMPRLRVLDAHGTGVDDAGIARIRPDNFPALEELSLSGCTRLSEITPLRHLGALRKLDLRHTPVRHGLAALQHCTRLRELAIASDAIGVEQLRHRQPELYQLDYFASLHTLTALSLDNVPRLTARSLELLAFSHAPLESLLLRRVPQLTSLEGLRGVPTLKHLTVERAEQLTNDGLRMGSLPRLEHITLRRCPQVSSFNDLHTLPALRYLDVRLNGSGNVSTNSFKDFAAAPKDWPLEVLLASQYDGLTALHPFRGLPLRVLDVRCSGVDDDGLRAVLDGRRIEALYLCYCTTLTCATFLARLPLLRTLDLSGTRVEDHSLWELCHAPALETLRLDNCPGLRFQPFLHVFRHLTVLSLADNPQLHTKALKAFMYLSDESEDKYIHPLFPTFAHVSDLNISRTSVDSVEPLVNLRCLEKLRASGTPLTPDGLRTLADIRGLQLLDLRCVTTLLGELRPLFTQHHLRRLDLRGALLAGPAQSELPLPLLADSSLRELAVDHGDVAVLLPLLRSPQALPHLRQLLVAGAEGLEETAAAAFHSLPLKVDPSTNDTNNQLHYPCVTHETKSRKNFVCPPVQQSDPLSELSTLNVNHTLPPTPPMPFPSSLPTRLIHSVGSPLPRLPPEARVAPRN